MTLILAINGRETIWLLADRRLSYENRVPRDDAHKIMFLETPDGVAILGYAGLGATALGTEPADWMSAVLRGRNLPLEKSLSILAEALKRQFPRHLVKIPRNSIAAHNVIIPAFLNKEVRFYSIDLAFASDRKNYSFRYTRWQMQRPGSAISWSPRFVLGGTGGLFLYNNKQWIRNLLDLVKAKDHCRVSAYVVADNLAKLNYEVHSKIGDKSVGPSCIVAWRDRKGGGAHQFYTETTRDKNVDASPSIAGGLDIRAIIEATKPFDIERFKAMEAGNPPKEIDSYELKEKIARLPSKPDENLL